MRMLLFTSTVMAMASAASAAVAGGFGLRAQSAYGEGSSYAGMAAPGDSISSMFWNPAAVTIVTSQTFEGSAAFVFPDSELDVDPSRSTLTALGITGNGGNVGEVGIIPATYFATPITESVYFGVGVTSPFGLASTSDEPWVGMFSHLEANALSINVSPILGVRVNDMLSIAVGAQIQYFDVDIKTAMAPVGSPPEQRFEGDDIGAGFVAGVTITPWDGTVLGIGYRSTIKHSLDGNQKFDIPLVTGAGIIPAETFSVSADITLPETVSIGLRQRVNEVLTALAGVEWTNWSRVQAVELKDSPAGTDLVFNYDDGWVFSLGAEYIFNEDVTLRAGASYEISPTPDETRSMRLPDADRYWASIGASYKLAERFSIDVAYTHLFVDDASVDETIFGIRYAGTAEGKVDTIAFGLRYEFGS